MVLSNALIAGSVELSGSSSSCVRKTSAFFARLRAAHFCTHPTQLGKYHNQGVWQNRIYGVFPYIKTIHWIWKMFNIWFFIHTLNLELNFFPYIAEPEENIASIHWIFENVNIWIFFHTMEIAVKRPVSDVLPTRATSCLETNILSKKVDLFGIVIKSRESGHKVRWRHLRQTEFCFLRFGGEHPFCANLLILSMIYGAAATSCPLGRRLAHYRTALH